MKGYRIQSDKRAAILADILAGMKRMRVARKYGVNKDTVARIARDHAAGRTRREESAEERECDMSMEELDALIADSMKELPEWWKRDNAGDRGGPCLPQVVARGMGLQARHRRESR